jgi:hypothetical protein
MLSQPEQLQVQADSYLEPHLLHAVFPLQAARHILFRHNMSSHCSKQDRDDAINRCYSVARDTLRYIERCTRPPSSPDGQGQFRSRDPHGDILEGQANHFMVKHIWRTTLILCLKGDYNAALTCVRLSASIGGKRKVNLAGGRFLSHFLDRLLQKMRDGRLSPHQLEADEEMIALATGDMQGDPEHAWIWTEPDGDREGEHHLSSSSNHSHSRLEESWSSALLTQPELEDWGGWERVEKLLGELMEEQVRQSRAQNPYHQPAHNMTKRLQLSPSLVNGHSDKSPRDTVRSNDSPKAPTVLPAVGPPVGASRISIANII